MKQTIEALIQALRTEWNVDNKVLTPQRAEILDKLNLAASLSEEV
jgi:hypothetical protein